MSEIISYIILCVNISYVGSRVLVQFHLHLFAFIKNSKLSLFLSTLIFVLERSFQYLDFGG